MKPTSRPLLLLALSVILPIAAVRLLLPPTPPAAPAAPAAPTVPVETDAPGHAEEETALEATAPAAPSWTIERFFLGQGGTLAAACERVGLDPAVRTAVLDAATRHLDLRRLSPRTGLAVRRDADGTPRSLAIRSEPERFLRITLPDGSRGLRAELLPLTTSRRVESSAGTVSSSVAQALAHLPHGRLLTQAYADIFQWDVDLFVDPRPGDEVRLVYEIQTLGEVPDDLPRFGGAAARPGEFVAIGRVLAARYEGEIASATAYWVADGPSWGNYYDAEGRPLRKNFLKSPLNYRRISSGFSNARRNPVTRRVVPHHGVDFAADPGTPVTTTADGRVVSAGWDGPLGNAVRIRHGSEYVTVYGHLRGFARGIKAGVEVRQGQVVGYVGSTGRSSGPHLHYTVLKGGRPIDPMRMKNPSAEPLDKRMLPWLEASRRRWDAVLAAAPAGARLDVADGSEHEVPDDAILSGS